MTIATFAVLLTFILEVCLGKYLETGSTIGS